MAKLENKIKNILIELTLYARPKDSRWVGYGLFIGPCNKDINKSLTLFDSELYFEACFELEVTEFCNGILEVLDEKKSYYFFEPLDQEDFQFLIRQKRGDYFGVYFQSDLFDIPKAYNCPDYVYLGVEADFEKQQILDFVDQLQQEYSKIIASYPKDLHCIR